jgi:hypothetical protein
MREPPHGRHAARVQFDGSQHEQLQLVLGSTSASGVKLQLARHHSGVACRANCADSGVCGPILYLFAVEPLHLLLVVAVEPNYAADLRHRWCAGAEEVGRLALQCEEGAYA